MTARSQRATSRSEDGGTRRRLIEATIEIMHDEGYAAATSRRVAARANVKQALVYYYFPTMDDLFLEVLRAGSEAALARLRDALTADDPVRTLWLINSDARQTVLNTEVMALANHRKIIGAELKAYAERVRDIESAAVAMMLRTRGVDMTEHSPVAISMLIAQLARSMANERAVGVSYGHRELEAFVEQLLTAMALRASVGDA
ncbi:TetR/AcrR family transcriptional regulator [Mycobacterium sp. MYCO198283]|uniref:TetR/AcrR family transcriptional regulator n=1 Tax=Mycobacterium sp. MYCO198283 TaxID=2883505 RepID=UPI001E4D1D15|nr:TetR/AcrR family transcriptional regulator [Mycobacterium sp. MYCO198283]MCG5432222.1 TetR/AcrR family transcriptional regulator [Mycobacterium sp. MYCO198283]